MPFLADSQRSHPSRKSQRTPDKTKVETMGALFQGYMTPPCCRANIRRMDAAREAKAPAKSMRLHVLLERRLSRNTLDFPYGKPKGTENATNKTASAPPGPLAKV